MVIGVKIKNRKTGEFRKAGSYSHWNKIGKIKKGYIWFFSTNF